jgi:CRISPR-associated protein Cas1
MKEKILNMSYAEWKRMGSGKGSLHYLKKNAVGEEPFIMYG